VLISFRIKEVILVYYAGLTIALEHFHMLTGLLSSWTFTALVRDEVGGLDVEVVIPLSDTKPLGGGEDVIEAHGRRLLH
jgi:hypothetical protein